MNENDEQLTLFLFHEALNEEIDEYENDEAGENDQFLLED